MGYYPIVDIHQKQMEGLDHLGLPTAYMADYSVLGFRVHDCKRALNILEKASFDLQQRHGRTLLKIDKPARISEAIQVLHANGEDCELTDVAQGMYQG